MLFKLFRKQIETHPFILGLTIVLFSFLPFFILGENIYLNIFDNLDSEFVYLHVLKISHNLLGFDYTVPVNNIFDGIPRGYIHSEWSFIRVLFFFFPSFWAYVINFILIRIIGFVGFYVLARDYFPSTPNRSVVTFICAIVFCSLPIMPIFCLTVMGQPILLWSFLNLIEKQKIFLSFLIIIIIPFYTHLALLAPFVLIALVVFGGFRKFYFRKPVPFHYWLGIAILFSVFLIANSSIILNFILPSTPSHRLEFSPPVSSFKEIVIKATKILRYGQEHSSSLNALPLLILIFYYFLKKVENRKTFIIVVMTIILIAIQAASYRTITQRFFSDFTILFSFQFDRFVFLYPLFYFILILMLIQNTRVKKRWIYVVLFFMPLKNLQFHEIGYNWIRLFVNTEQIRPDLPSFSSFYAKNLFSEIKTYIGKPQESYRVVCVGMHPSILQYNGFYTMDSYQNNYPLSYKKFFRPVIAKELEKNDFLRKKYDNRGNMCYIFSDVLEKSCYLNCHKGVQLEGSQIIDINFEPLKKKNTQYVFSAIPIENRGTPLILEKVFANATSRWNIYLYKIK